MINYLNKFTCKKVGLYVNPLFCIFFLHSLVTRSRETHVMCLYKNNPSPLLTLLLKHQLPIGPSFKLLRVVAHDKGGSTQFF